jgi:hypothetical protein
MNPYSRFRLVSSTASAALIVAGLCVFGAPVVKAVAETAGSGTSLWLALGASVVVLVVFWLALTEAIFPSLFRFNAVRKMVLGKYYIEGTWLQAERGTNGGHRLAVIDIQPAGRSFIFSGYALNQDLEIESNTLIEFSKFEWPFMSFKYRNSLSDGADGQREGVGEIQFEMNRTAATRFNGFAQFVKAARRIKIEGAKLTKNAEVRRLRSLEGRKAVLEKYWNLFFNTSLETSARQAAPATRRPVIVEAASGPFVERRQTGSAPAESSVVPRRRASDWRNEDATPTADRIRARMEDDLDEEDETDALYEEEEAFEAEDDADSDTDDEDEMMLEDEVDDIDAEDENDEAEEAEADAEPVRHRSRFGRR